MIRIDSIKLQVSNDSIKDYKPDQFLRSLAFDSNNNEVSNKLYLQNQYLGIKNIVINQRNESTELEISSKLLKENYKDLINKNNIELVVNRINDTGVIEFDRNEFIDSALIHHLDITNNLKPERSLEKICRDLHIYSVASKYKLDKAISNTGLVVNGRAKTNNERMIFYDKFEELNKPTKANRILRNEIDINDFCGVLRVESNLKKFKNIRNAFNLKTLDRIYLKDILISDEKINYNMFNKMFDLNTEELDVSLLNQKKVFINLLDSKIKGFSNLERLIGRRQIVVNCDYDLDEIRKVIQERVKGNIRSYYIPIYKKLIKQMRSEIIGDLTSINELRELLRVA